MSSTTKMGFVKFLRFLKYKLRRKRVSDRVVAIDISDGNNNNDDDSEYRHYMKRYSWDEIRKLTSDFSVIIGYGGYGTVYLARSSLGLSAAVKVQCCSSERLSQAYRQELEVLRGLDHPNIVKLLGHCEDREEGILILEYIPNGNLHERLHGPNATTLSWKARVSIIYQLAQAIDYLHEKCSPHIVHGDIKASNVLLDEKLNCKICDFGSAKMGFSSTITPSNSNNYSVKRNKITMVGSHGYTDPHYITTGLASKKNDVYSLGVVILELISGLEAFDSSTGERLTKRVEPVLKDVENKVVEVVDRRLKGEFDFGEVKVMAMVASKCLSDVPSLRPCASEILTTMRSQIRISFH